MIAYQLSRLKEQADRDDELLISLIEGEFPGAHDARTVRFCFRGFVARALSLHTKALAPFSGIREFVRETAVELFPLEKYSRTIMPGDDFKAGYTHLPAESLVV